MTPACILALTEKTAQLPGRRQVPAADGLHGPAADLRSFRHRRHRHAAERAVTGVAFTSWNADQADWHG
jgi:hypothetical protein